MKKMTMIPIFVIILAVLALFPVAAREKEAIFGGGCFWCLEPPFESLHGVSEVISGYTGGHVENPSYQQVTQGNTGHFEAVRVVYNDDVISYEELLEVFWRNIDPTDRYGQFYDRGQQYQTAVFYGNGTEKRLAERSKAGLESSGKFQEPIATDILPAATFYNAEEYHQDYYKNNPTVIMPMPKDPDAKDFWQIFGKTRSGPCTINRQIVN